MWLMLHALLAGTALALPSARVAFLEYNSQAPIELELPALAARNISPEELMVAVDRVMCRDAKPVASANLPACNPLHQPSAALMVFVDGMRHLGSGSGSAPFLSSSMKRGAPLSVPPTFGTKDHSGMGHSSKMLGTTTGSVLEGTLSQTSMEASVMEKAAVCAAAGGDSPLFHTHACSSSAQVHGSPSGAVDAAALASLGIEARADSKMPGVWTLSQSEADLAIMLDTGVGADALTLQELSLLAALPQQTANHKAADTTVVYLSALKSLVLEYGESSERYQSVSGLFDAALQHSLMASSANEHIAIQLVVGPFIADVLHHGTRTPLGTRQDEREQPSILAFT
ncbi:unnamed protein product [Chrysoparadoxa australica]